MPPLLQIHALKTWFPITRGQIEMLLEGNVCCDCDGLAQFGITPKRFGPEALAYLRQ